MITKLTEADVLDLLRARHTAESQGGGRYAFATHVRSDAGFDAKRTFDAAAMDLWPSRGLTIDIFEVKVSRSDWQRELKTPAKAEDACKVADRFWIVAPAGCVKPGELPPTWGLIEVTGNGTDESPWKLRTKTSAPLLHEGDRRHVGVPRGLFVGWMRSTPGAVPGGRLPAATKSEVDAARESGRKQGLAEARDAASRTARDAESWQTVKAAIADTGGPRHISADRLAAHAAGIVRLFNGDTPRRHVGFALAEIDAAIAQLDRVRADLSATGDAS